MHDAVRAKGAVVAKSRWTALRSHQVGSPHQIIASLDLGTVTVKELDAITSSFEFAVTGRRADSVTCWFDVHFRSGEASSTLTTSPGIESLDTHWGQQTLPLQGLATCESVEADGAEGMLRGELEIFRVEGSQRMYDAKINSWEYEQAGQVLGGGGGAYYAVA